MKLTQSHKTLKFPPEFYDPLFEHLLQYMKFTICHAKLCKGTKNKSLLNTAQKIISNYIRANSKVSVCVGSPGMYSVYCSYLDMYINLFQCLFYK